VHCGAPSGTDPLHRGCARGRSGTRFLPATKTVPKELLPVVDTPGIELVAAEAGAGRLILVTSKGKDGVVAHFVEDLVLEGTLEARGKHLMLEKVRRASALIKVESVVQAEPLGLGHAISCVEEVLLPDEDAIAVLLPDDLVLPTGVLDTMSKVRAERGGSVLCAIEVETDEISAYGVFDVEIVPDAANRNVLRVKGMVEKPKAEDAPSPYAAAGRYVLDRAIFDALRRVAPGAGGDPADRRDRTADRTKDIRCTWWCIAAPGTTWATPAAT
jgi:UTP--glucose-1-phosphate uridylyltransferase